MKERSRRLLTGMAVIAGLLILGIAALYALRGILIGPRLADWLEKRAESELGLTVSIQRIGGTYIKDLSIERLKTLQPAPYGPLAALDIERIKIDYRLAALLDGVDRFLASISIDVQRADIILDWRRPKPATGPESEQAIQLPAALPVADHWPQIRINRSSLTMRAANVTSKLENIQLQLQPGAGGSVELQLHAAPWLWQIPEITSGKAPLQLRMTYQSGKALAVDSLRIGDNGLTTTARIDLDDLPHSLPFTLQLQVAGGLANLSGRLTEKAAAIRFQAGDIDLKAVSAVAPVLDSQAKGILTCRGDLHLPWNTPRGFDGSLTIDVRNGGYRRFAADDARLQATARSGTITVDKLDIRGVQNRAFVQNVTLPATLWTNPDHLQWLAALQGRFNLQLKDIPALLDMLAPGYAEHWTDIPTHMLLLDGNLEPGGRIRAQGHLSTGDNHIRMAPSRIQLSLVDGRLDDAALDVRLKIDVNDLARLASLFPLPRMAGQLSGDMAVGGSLKRPRGRAALSGNQIAVNQIPIGGLEAVLSADQSTITAERLLIDNAKDRLQIKGRYGIDRRSLENVQLLLAIARIEPYLGLWDRLPQTLQGDLQGRLQADGPLQAPSIRVQARSQKFVIGDLALSDIRLQAALRDGAVQADNVQARAFGGLVKTAGTLQYSKDFKSIEANLSKLFIERKDAQLSLAGPARVRFTAPDRLQISNLELAGQMGEIRLNGLLALQGVSDLDLQVNQLQSDGWLAEFWGREVEFEGLNVRGRIGGVLSDPQIVLAGDLARLSSAHLPVPLSGRFDLAYSEGTLSIAHFTWSGKDGYRAAIKGVIPLPCVGRNLLPADNLIIEAQVDLPDARAANLFLNGEPVVSGSLSAVLSLTGSWQEPLGELRFEAKNIEAQRQVTWVPPGPLQLSGKIGYQGDKMTIETMSFDSPNFTVSGQGYWQDGFGPQMLCRFERQKLSGDIAFDAKVRAADLGWLGSRFPQIRRIGGRLEADVRVRGPLEKPEVTAAVALNDGELRLQAELPALEAVQLNAHLTPAKIDIQQLQGLLGGSTVHLQGVIDDPMRENPAFDIRLWGENLLLYREQGLRIRADADLTLQGPLQALALSGRVALTDGLYDRYIDWLGGLQGSRRPSSAKGLHLFSLPDPPLKDMRIDVDIQARQPFRVRSNLVRAELRPELAMSGTGVAPLLTGRVLLDQAGLRLPSGTVVFEKGLVRFTEGDPDRPVLDLVGNTRMLGYDITVLIEGPYDDPVVTLSSSPPLSNEDLLLLVLTGTPPPREGQTTNPDKRNLNVAVYIGRDLLQRWFKGESDTTIDAILDRFEADIGRDITLKGEETLEARFRLREGIFRKKDTLYITGEKDVFDYYNAGVRIVFRFK